MPAAKDETVARVLAEFALGFDLSRVPQSTTERARHLLLDAVGVALASSSFDFGRIAVQSLAGFESGPTPVIGFQERLPVGDAALVNGILIHGIDYDDTSIYGRVHPSSFCAATALALAAHCQAPGSELLASYIVGLEAAIRIGAVARGGLQRRGFHPGGVVAPFAASLIASRLLKLSVEQCCMAQGIAYATAAGNQEFAATMAWTKRFHPGWGSAGGITAAVLASRGFTGPARPYEGKAGLYRLYIGDEEPELTLASEALGDRWYLDEISIKPLPACYFNIPLIDAALHIARDHKPDIGNIEQIIAWVPPAAINTICEPQEHRRRPVDSYAAQFSAYFVIAAALKTGRFSLDDLTPSALSDPAILAVADKVVCRSDPDTTFPAHYSGAVTVRMCDGATYMAREDVDRGSPMRPLSNADIVEKFRANARRSALSDRTDVMISAILTIDACTDASDLAELLSA